jgi:putative protease
MFITFGLCGSDTPELIAQYAAQGAEEFFAGFVPRVWLEKYGWEVCPNRRPLGSSYNYMQIEDLAEARAAAKRAGSRFNLALNSHDNGFDRLADLRALVETVEPLDPDGYIVADPALMFSLKSWGIDRPLHLSTGAGCFNAASVRFYCQHFDVRRVVIPRKVTLREVRSMFDSLRDLNLEFEVMIIGYRCHFNDENCHSIHSGARCNLCGDVLNGQLQVSKNFPDDWKEVVQAMHDDPLGQLKEGSALDEFRKAMNKTPLPAPPESKQPYFAQGLDGLVTRAIYQHCGLCAIKELRDIGVQALKVPLRGMDSSKLQSIAMVHAAMTAADPTPEFCRKLINSPSFCADPQSCYYHVPEAD